MATDPLQGGPTPSQNPGADPVKVLAPTQPGSPPADDHDVSGPPSPATIKRGYEEDVYDAKTILSVPLLVILFFVLAFGTVTVLFSIYSKPGVDPDAHPQAKARNQAGVTERLGRIGRGKEVDQPRLDQADRLDTRHNPFSITSNKLKDGNSRHVHPEDLIPSKEGTRELYDTARGTPLDKTLALDNAALKAMFQSSAPPLPDEASRHVPSGANAGRGAEGSLVTLPKAPEAKQPEPKKAPEPIPPPKPKEEKK